MHPPGRPASAQVRAVRPVLIAAASKPALDQVAIRAETHEGGMFPEVFPVLETSDGALMEVYSREAGCCSLAKATRIAEAHQGDIFGLKGHQPELLREAERVLASQTQPEPSSSWEKYQGDQIRYHL